MFGGASNLAEGVDRAFIFIFSVAFIFIIGITIFMIWMVIKFNRKKKKEAMQFTGSVTLEIIWTVVPSILVLMMFYYGWMGFRPMRTVPENAMTIKAIGRMWKWEFDYGDGKLCDSLVVPFNVPVKLDLISEDVNHSLFIPAFRVKEDVVPGYDNYLWFTATVKGTYDLYCTEYCGTLHWDMTTNVTVIEENEYEGWLANLEAIGDIPDPAGLLVIKENGCLACHSLDGSPLLGPSLKNFFGSERLVETKEGPKTVIADEAYTKNSIYDPNSEIADGYKKGLMQSYEKLIDDEQMNHLIDYLKTLNE